MWGSSVSNLVRKCWNKHRVRKFAGLGYLCTLQTWPLLLFPWPQLFWFCETISMMCWDNSSASEKKSEENCPMLTVFWEIVSTLFRIYKAQSTINYTCIFPAGIRREIRRLPSERCRGVAIQGLQERLHHGYWRITAGLVVSAWRSRAVGLWKQGRLHLLRQW